MTKTLAERDLETVWHPYSPLSNSLPVEISHARGELLFTQDGREIIDLIASWWVNIHGHCHPEIQSAVARQLGTLDHVIFAGFTHEPAVQLAEGLLRHLPEGQERIFFSDNGSTAVEVAIKMAIQFWAHQGQERHRIAVLEGSYHGDTVGAMSVSERGLFTRVFKDMLFDVIVLPRPAGDGEAFLRAVRELMSESVPAAFIYEPLVQGAGGMFMYQPDVLDAALGLLQQHGVVCIADEVMTGFGRTGRWFASDYMVRKPDILTMSKGITGGVLPLGVTSCNDRIAAQFRSDDRTRTFFHGHSYTANPVACSAAVASLRLLESPAVWEQISRIEEQHRQAAEQFRQVDRVLDVRQRGTLLALTIEDTRPGYLSPIGSRFYQFFLERGVLIRPLGNVIYLMPPYCVSAEHLERGYHTIMEALESL